MKDNNSPFRDVGRVANAQEARSSSMTKASDGCFYLVICSQGFVTSVNLNTGESGYYPFPEGYTAYPFGSMGSRTGKVYFGAGKMFYEFDPAQKAYTFCEAINKTGTDNTCEAWSPFEAADGRIFFGAYPVTHLMSFDPKSRSFTEYGVMAEDQSYLTSEAADKAGWIYCGIGTQKPTIVAFHPETGEKRILSQCDANGESAEVRLGTDGEVYGALDGSTHGCAYSPNKHWYRLYGGKLQERAEKPFTTYYTSGGFDAIHCPFEEHPEIIESDLVEHLLTYRHPDSSKIITIPLEYDVAGADLSPITAGPDGKLYGTTNHPIQLFTYDPKTDLLVNHGRKPFAKHISGWGNICAYASQGDILAGAAYCGGFIVRFDTAQPICRELDDVNPHCEAAFDEVLRPRSAAALPDGERVVFGGFNMYGKTGGGLIVYNCAARTSRLIPNEKLLPQHSVLAIVPLSETRLLCGTSIEAPGGGKETAAQAELFEFDLSGETVIYSAVPVPGSKAIAHMKQDATGTVHGITQESVYFTYDPVSHKLLQTRDLSKNGTPVRDGMALAEDGTLYGLLPGGIYRILPGTNSPEFLPAPPCPITCGMAMLNGKLYFGSQTHLWSCTLPLE